jgi:hypothetical protein
MATRDDALTVMLYDNEVLGGISRIITFQMGVSITIETFQLRRALHTNAFFAEESCEPLSSTLVVDHCQCLPALPQEIPIVLPFRSRPL